MENSKCLQEKANDLRADRLLRLWAVIQHNPSNFENSLEQYAREATGLRSGEGVSSMAPGNADSYKANKRRLAGYTKDEKGREKPLYDYALVDAFNSAQASETINNKFGRNPDLELHSAERDVRLQTARLNERFKSWSARERAVAQAHYEKPRKLRETAEVLNVHIQKVKFTVNNARILAKSIFSPN